MQLVFALVLHVCSLAAASPTASVGPARIYKRDDSLLCQWQGPVRSCFQNGGSASITTVSLTYFSNGTLFSSGPLQAWSYMNGKPNQIASLDTPLRDAAGAVYAWSGTVATLTPLPWALQVAVFNRDGQWDSLYGRNYRFFIDPFPGPSDVLLPILVAGIPTQPGEYLNILGDIFGLGQSSALDAFALAPSNCNGALCDWTGVATIPSGYLQTVTFTVTKSGSVQEGQCSPANKIRLERNSSVVVNRTPGFVVYFC
ncbi:hypothetical protein HDV03_000428 [Kappamyces sp. JEL0829]|nr:hypothetical protein HDV03_000428 [Kappamyces sp. JEL0829]